MSVKTKGSWDIKRWDAVINECSSLPQPCIFLEPDVEFLQFVRDNNNKVRILITGTNSNYDGVQFGIVDSSSTTPSCRSNFFTSTGMYVISLPNLVWQSYPRSLGKFTLIESPIGGVKKEVVLASPKKPEVIIASSSPPNGKKEGLSSHNLGLLGLLLVIVSLSAFQMNK